MSQQIDPRGPRFGAAVTTVVLAVTLITIDSTLALVLLAIQATAFGLGTFVGLGAQPYGVIYKKLVQPRIGKPAELEDSAPPRFAQSVGFAFAVVGLIALLADNTLIAQISVGLALGAAFLNSAFAFCLGCEMYLIGKRIFS